MSSFIFTVEIETLKCPVAKYGFASNVASPDLGLTAFERKALLRIPNHMNNESMRFFSSNLLCNFSAFEN